MYPEWYEEQKSKCMQCGKLFDGDPNAGEVGQPGEKGHAFLCPSCYKNHPEAKARPTKRAADGFAALPDCLSDATGIIPHIESGGTLRRR